MRIVFDPIKDATNRAKHGLGLDLAGVLFSGRYEKVIDDRFDYGEMRFVAVGEVNGRVLVCVYVERSGAKRIISLRKANTREVTSFEQNC